MKGIRFFDNKFLKGIIKLASIVSILFMVEYMIDVYKHESKYNFESDNNVQLNDTTILSDNNSDFDIIITNEYDQSFFSNSNLKRISEMSHLSDSFKNGVIQGTIRLDTLIPTPINSVTDYTDELNKDQIDVLSNLINGYGDNSGIKFYITIVYPFMYGETLGNLSDILYNKIISATFPESKNIVLMTFDMKSGTFFCFVDYEIKKIFSDIDLQQLIDNEISKQNNNFTGIYQSVIILANKIIGLKANISNNNSD